MIHEMIYIDYFGIRLQIDSGGVDWQFLFSRNVTGYFSPQNDKIW